MKKCRNCGTEKELDAFKKEKRSKDGAASICKSCASTQSSNYYINNKEKISKKAKEKYKNNPDHYKDKSKAYRKSDSYKENYPKYHSKYYTENREDILERSRKYYENNKDKIKEYKKNWQSKNRSRLNAKLIERRASDPEFKLIYYMRSRLRYALLGKDKSTTTEKLLGCSSEKLRNHLESLWLEGMSWDNYGRGGWHVDHILPCGSFDLSLAENQAKCFHYTNLQPLWELDNLKKGSKIFDTLNI